MGVAQDSPVAKNAGRVIKEEPGSRESNVTQPRKRRRAVLHRTSRRIYACASWSLVPQMGRMLGYLLPGREMNDHGAREEARAAEHREPVFHGIGSRVGTQGRDGFRSNAGSAGIRRKSALSTIICGNCSRRYYTLRVWCWSTGDERERLSPRRFAGDIAWGCRFTGNSSLQALESGVLQHDSGFKACRKGRGNNGCCSCDTCQLLNMKEQYFVGKNPSTWE